MLKNILDPDLYHGHNKKENFFEGWYFKVVNPKGDVFAIIPGIKHSSITTENYSFIQVYYGNFPHLDFIKYPFSYFKASKKIFEIHINNNIFSLNEIKLLIENDNLNIKVNLKIKNIKKWPDSLLNPGSMGFYNYICFMECYSQICSIIGDIDGNIIYNNTTFDFNNSKIYIEKNWGKEFPYSYIWAQCNNFKNENDISITCSIAHIPLPIGSFTGFLIGLYTKDNFYKFTSINKSKLIILTEENKIHIQTYNKNFSLLINCIFNKDKFVCLYAPIKNTMKPIARETLVGHIEIILKDIKKNTIILKTQGSYAGIEFSGDINSLIKSLRHMKENKESKMRRIFCDRQGGRFHR